MNSDMSNRMSALLTAEQEFGERAGKLPFSRRPWGRGTGRNQPGVWGDFKPARERRMARERAEIAFSWLMMR